jgi:Glutamate dehydrogenase/leucine dehydrogenase
MKLFETLAKMGHEEVVMCSDPSCGYRGILAVHSTRLGPALGGTRFWNYATEDEAITDALRLSRGMTYKNAVAGLNLGGGKSIIIGDNRITDARRFSGHTAASLRVSAAGISPPKTSARARATWTSCISRPVT